MEGRSGRARGAAAVIALAAVLVAATGGEARGARGWSWPVEGGVITRYSNDDANPYARGVHRGIDIAAPAGAAVRAARAGEVTYAGALGYSGWTVAVRTGDGFVTSYLHLSAVAVRRGESLRAGERVGEVGTSGRRSTREPHLHFGVRRAGVGRRYVDPLSLLPRRGTEEAGTPAPAPVAPAPRPAPAPAPARALPAPAPVRSPQPHGAPALRPLPAPHPRARPVPRAPAPEPAARARRAERPVAVPPPRVPARAPGWGGALALGGLALVLAVLFGRGAARLLRDVNAALAGRVYLVAHGAARFARRSAPAYLARWRRAT